MQNRAAIISKYKMINFDNVAKENNHSCRILLTGGFVSGKTNALLNLMNNQSDIDKIYLYAKYPYEANYQFVINNCEIVELKENFTFH